MRVDFNLFIFQVLATLLYAAPTYFMTSQPLEMNRILLFLTMCILTSLTAQGFGFLIGALMGIKAFYFKTNYITM